jgi:hypothetical protein
MSLDRITSPGIDLSIPIGEDSPPPPSSDLILPKIVPNPSSSTSEKNLPSLPHNTRFPVLRSLSQDGDVIVEGEDTARYMAAPEQGRFTRPWLAIPGEAAFVWPLGVQGFNIRVQPNLGVHKFLGSNHVEIDVMHVGEEHIRMTGVFPGLTSSYNAAYLKDIVLRETPEQGKILFIPLVLPKYQYVVVEEAEFDHVEDDRYHDITYTIVFFKIGVGKKTDAGLLDTRRPVAEPTNAAPRGTGDNIFVVNDTTNTLRTVSDEVFGTPDEWARIGRANKAFFEDNQIPDAQAPDHRLPTGLVLRFD